MKSYINRHGILKVIAENGMEEFALMQWINNSVLRNNENDTDNVRASSLELTSEFDECFLDTVLDGELYDN